LMLDGGRTATLISRKLDLGAQFDSATVGASWEALRVNMRLASQLEMKEGRN
jgi:hypothetical protein